MPRGNQEEANELRKLETAVINLERFLIDVCEKTEAEKLSKDLVYKKLGIYKNPPKERLAENAELEFFEVLEKYASLKSDSIWVYKRLMVLKRALQRFELYKRATGYPHYRIKLNDLDVDDINQFERFLRSEHELYTKYPKIYTEAPADTRKTRKKPKPEPKGDNTIINLFGNLRAFYHWCNKQGLSSNEPFAKYTGKTTEKYGTPNYITIDERDLIADFDLSANPSLAVQRDIFIFQCLIGCRVSDLMSMTPESVIDDAVEYMPQKTKTDRPQVVRVPLNSRAKALVEKYKDNTDCKSRLFPFISSQKYNVAIKNIFTLCGVTRLVTVLNPTTGKEEKRPINELASSHLARRTFIGNLYRKVKDPILVGSLSGHAEGSKAFARYRTIDDEMKRELVNLID